MGAMSYARFPNGRVTPRPRLEDYEGAVHFLEAEMEAARHDGLSLRFIRLRADLAAYRSVLRRLYWRRGLSSGSKSPWF